MTLSMQSVIGDYRAFFNLLNSRLANLGIDIAGLELSHLAYRTATGSEYLRKRDEIERFCKSNVENVWNGRPISIMQLNEALDLGDGFAVGVIELIPPLHRRVYKMGLEHLGVVVGDTVDEFSVQHRAALTGQQFQSKECEPYYVTFFDDFTMVKFYDNSLLRICEQQRSTMYTGFSHVKDWQFAD